MRTVERILKGRHARITRLTSARLQFVNAAFATGIPPERALAGLDFLRSSGLSEGEALSFATEQALQCWPPDDLTQ